MDGIKIFINIRDNKLTIQRITRRTVFSEGKYIIESDSRGFSMLEQRDDGVYLVNVLEGKKIREEKITEDEAKHIIRETTYERIRWIE